jgi:mannose-6-phosphate isomerase-like protein (cupin superfamily)
VLLSNTKNCLVHSSQRLVACANVQDLAVIESDDALLVVDRRQSEPVKQLVASLNEAERPEAVRHSTVELGWGREAVLARTSAFRVRRLDIDPGRSCEVTGDAGDALHWLVIAGKAEFSQGDQRRTLEAGDSVDAAGGSICRLGNLGDQPLILLETGRPCRAA